MALEAGMTFTIEPMVNEGNYDVKIDMLTRKITPTHPSVFGCSEDDTAEKGANAILKYIESGFTADLILRVNFWYCFFKDHQIGPIIGGQKFEFESSGHFKNAKAIGYKVGRELLKKAGADFTVEGN